MENLFHVFPLRQRKETEHRGTGSNRISPYFTRFRRGLTLKETHEHREVGMVGPPSFSGCFRPNLCVVLIASNSWHLTIQHYPTINPSTHHLASVGHSPGSGASASVRMDLRCFPRFWSHRAWWGQKLDVDPSGTGRLQRHCFPCRLWT